jgi:triosephosphate isomerase
MNRKFLIVANWKAKVDQEFVIRFCKDLKTQLEKIVLPENIQIAIAPPFVYLETAKRILNDTKILLATQDISEFDNGAYTGEITARMLKDFDVSYAIVGHSERRSHKHESNNVIEAKINKAIIAGIKPIIAISDESEFPTNLRNLSADKYMLMYEPAEAISSNENAQPVSPNIVEKKREGWSKKMAVDLNFLYGGSVDANYMKKLLIESTVSGVVVGSKSLDVNSFLGLVKEAINDKLSF